MAINRLGTFMYLIDTYKKYVIYYVRYIKSYANSQIEFQFFM